MMYSIDNDVTNCETALGIAKQMGGVYDSDYSAEITYGCLIIRFSKDKKYIINLNRIPKYKENLKQLAIAIVNMTRDSNLVREGIIEPEVAFIDIHKNKYPNYKEIYSMDLIDFIDLVKGYI